jgi:5-(carboxyamino)imidazole ribonucleotide mutase
LKKIAIIMGSKSDMQVMQAAADIISEFQVPYEVSIVSAHRTPHRMVTYAERAKEKNIGVIIAGAGGAAHLPGMVASLTDLPVIGVPVLSSNSLLGIDSILSILQMPGGIPVATVALNNAKNAGLLALRILSVSNEELYLRLSAYREKMKNEVEKSAAEIEKNINF